MSCIFCSSMYHLSPFCDTYISDEDRKKSLEIKSYCKYCLKPMNGFPCGCKYIPKCYICFSKNHLDVFCPQRFSVLKPFLPKIDYVLMPRYENICEFHPLEALILSFYLPKNLKLFQQKQSIKIHYIDYFYNNYYSNNDGKIIVVKKICLRSADLKIPSKDFRNLNFIAENVALIDSKLTSNEILRLLSPATKMLKCDNITVTTKITFAEILQKIPNIEELHFIHSNIQICNFWFEELNSNYKVGKTLKKLTLTIESSNFSIEKLAAFIRTKCAQDVQVQLRLQTELYSQDFQKALFKYFVPFQYALGTFPLLFLQIAKAKNHPMAAEEFYSKNFSLKKL